VHVLDVESTVSPETQPPSDLGEAVAVRAGGQASAVQRPDGTWRAWGPGEFAVAQVNQTGLALDLGVYFGGQAEYLIWIEPND